MIFSGYLNLFWNKTQKWHFDIFVLLWLSVCNITHIAKHCQLHATNGTSGTHFFAAKERDAAVICLALSIICTLSLNKQCSRSSTLMVIPPSKASRMAEVSLHYNAAQWCVIAALQSWNVGTNYYYFWFIILFFGYIFYFVKQDSTSLWDCRQPLQTATYSKDRVSDPICKWSDSTWGHDP